MTITVLHGDCRSVLPTLAAESVNCIVTSPPYFGLRSYLPDGHSDKAKEIGLEQTPDAYVAELVAVFRECRRALRADGVAFLNLGDSYVSHDPGGHRDGEFLNPGGRQSAASKGSRNRAGTHVVGMKRKDLIGIPWMVAFALRADGWYLRSDIIFSKPNPMPESVRDRPTKAHEYVFLLTKGERYWYDADAIAEAADLSRAGKLETSFSTSNPASSLRHDVGRAVMRTETRNARSVWTIATQPFTGAHFATMPPLLAERCIKAGCPAGGMVLDPFGGAGTTALVADRLGRNATIIELNPAYADMARDRIRGDAPLLAEISAA